MMRLIESYIFKYQSIISSNSRFQINYEQINEYAPGLQVHKTESSNMYPLLNFMDEREREREWQSQTLKGVKRKMRCPDRKQH